MAGPFAFGEAEVLTFTQRGGEPLKTSCTIEELFDYLDDGSIEII